MDAKDVSGAFQAAHALKGVCGNLSITSLLDIVVPLVEALRTEHYEEALPFMQSLEKQYQNVISILSEIKDKE